MSDSYSFLSKNFVLSECKGTKKNAKWENCSLRIFLELLYNGTLFQMVFVTG